MPNQSKYASLLQSLFPSFDQENYQLVVSRAQAVAKSHVINMSDPFTFSNFLSYLQKVWQRNIEILRSARNTAIGKNLAYIQNSLAMTEMSLKLLNAGKDQIIADYRAKGYSDHEMIVDMAVRQEQIGEFISSDLIKTMGDFLVACVANDPSIRSI